MIAIPLVSLFPIEVKIYIEMQNFQTSFFLSSVKVEVNQVPIG